VDAAIISAPSSTKKRQKEWESEMHQKKKGNQWYCGMKTHVGVDSRTKPIHWVAATSGDMNTAGSSIPSLPGSSGSDDSSCAGKCYVTSFLGFVQLACITMFLKQF
jgi:hypothetical protein